MRSDGAVNSIKFLCSYGGKILPRPTDGMLRYIGGTNRILAVDRHITFSDLLVKMIELCGCSVTLRCQLPMEDLDTLVSVTSNEDLANLIEEYERASKAKSTPLKIRAFLWRKTSIKKVSPPLSPAVGYVLAVPPVTGRCVHQMQKPLNFSVCGSKIGYYYNGLPPRYPCHSHSHIHIGNRWQ